MIPSRVPNMLVWVKNGVL